MDYLISSIFSTSVLTTLDSTPGGGLVKALARNLVVNILSNVITNVHSYTGNGGLLLLTSFNNIEASIIGNKLVNVSDALKGTLLYANADGYSNIEYISNTFNCTDSITSEMFT